MLHWSLLAAAVGILCSENISKSGLVTANQMLKDFVILAENLCGVKRCPMNVHQLTHLSFYVLKRGPLWAYSCFAFEGFNAVIKSLVHGTHHAAEQIGCALGLSLGLARLVEKIFCDFIFLPPKVKKLLCKFSGTKLKKSNTKTSIDHGAFLGKPKLPTSVDENIFEVIRNITTQKGWAMCPTANSTSFYSRFVSDKGHLFYYLIHKESKKFNSTVIEYQTNNKTAFGVIHSFIELNTSNKGLCVIYQLNQIEQDFNYIDRIDDETLDNETQEIVNKYKGKSIIQHQYFVNNAMGSLDVIPTKDIIHKCILIDENLWVLSKFPNCIEPH